MDKRPSSPAALIDFVLHNAVVRSYVCTFVKNENGYACERRVVGDYNLLYTMRGRVTWYVGDQPVPMRPGDLCIVPPGVANSGVSLGKKMTLGSIHAEITLPGGQDVLTLLRPPRLQRVKAGGALDRYFRGAMEEFCRRDRRDAMTMMSAWARLIMLELVRSNAADGVLEYEPIDPIVLDLLGELNRRLAEPVTLTQLAKVSGYSAQHLNRVFSSVLGVTPLQYLGRLRMEHAARLLRDTNLTVRAVGQRMGFDDAYYFSRQFSRHFGRSPAQYREQGDANG